MRAPGMARRVAALDAGRLREKVCSRRYRGHGVNAETYRGMSQEGYVPEIHSSWRAL